MRWLIRIFLVVSLGVGLAILMRFNHGNVAILWPPYRLDLSVNFALLALLGLFLLLHLALIATGKAFDLPTRVREYRRRRRSGSARIALRDALLAFFEGRFGRAERLAKQAREDDELAGAGALLAARAAHRMRETERRDHWMELAEGEKNSAQAELMLAAEFALDEGDPARALLALERLHGGGLRHIHSMRASLRAHEQSGDWAGVLQVLRLLEKRDALPDAAVRAMRVRACRELFSAQAMDAASVREALRGLKVSERELPETVEAAASALVRAGDQIHARKLIESAMDDQFSALLLAVYTSLDEIPARERIERAERWLARHGDDGALSLALGRLCMSASLWGKAEEFLRRSMLRSETVAVHLAMAELHEALERPQDAASHYRAAALLRSNAN
jgi:HemY protein